MYRKTGKEDCSDEVEKDEWRIMKSEYELYHFNGGWLYNSKVHTRTRKQVDRELMQLRIMGDIRGLIEQRVFTYDKTHEIRYNIGGPTVLIPNVLFVFPSLIGCVLVLILWNPIKARDRREDGVVHSDADSGK